MRIRELDDGAAGAWDAFVQAAPDATFFHLSPWRKVIEQAFGHRTYYAYAEQDGSIVGVLPLGERTPQGGRPRQRPDSIHTVCVTKIPRVCFYNTCFRTPGADVRLPP